MAESAPVRHSNRAKKARRALDVAHALHNVTATMSSAVGLLRASLRSPFDQSLLDLLEHAVREAEDLSSTVAALGTTASQERKAHSDSLNGAVLGKARSLFRNDTTGAADVLAIFPSPDR